MKRDKTRRMILIALFAAIISVLSQFSIPMPSGMPLTLQTLAIALCGCFLGAKDGTLSVLVFLALGAVGLPVFSGFGAGLAKLTGVTGGFLFGFVPMAALCGAGYRAARRAIGAMLCAAGLIVCHLLGTAQFALVTGAHPIQAFLTVSAPYLIKDALSIAAAWLLTRVMARRMKQIQA